MQNPENVNVSVRTNPTFILPIQYFIQVNELLNIIHDIVQYSRMYFNASTSHFDYGLRLCSAWWVPFVIMVIGLVALILTIVATALETCRVITGLIIASLNCGRHKVVEKFIGAQQAQSMKEEHKEIVEFSNKYSIFLFII